MAMRVVKQVVAEVRGKSDQLERDMQVVEQKVGRTKRAIETQGTAISGLGGKYAAAARQIASGTEAIAASGRVSSGAAKQILTAGSQIAFAFGPAGAAVGAISIFALAVSSRLSRVREEMEETARKTEETITRMVNAGDVEGLKGRARDLFLGTPAGQFQDGIAARQRRLAEVQARIPRGADAPFLSGTAVERQFGPAARAAVGEAARLKAELAPLVAEYERLRKAILDLRAPTTSGTASPITISGKSPEQEARELLELGKAVDQFGRNVERLVRQDFSTQVEQVTQAFDELLAEGRAAGLSSKNPRIQQLEALKAVAVETTRVLAETEQTLVDLDLAALSGESSRVETLGTLTDRVEALRTQLGRLTPGTKLYLQVQTELLKVEREREKILQGIFETGGDGEGATRTAADLAREIQQAADGALQLAVAFGAVDSGAANVLRSVAQIAGNLPALQQALTAGSTLGVLGAALPIAGAFASLLGLGRNPEDARRREELRKNTEAIRELTAKAGLLGIGLGGSDAGRALAEVRRLLQGPTIGTVLNPRAAARAAGIDLGLLDRVAAELGITLNKSITSFQQLELALADTITKLGEFGTDLASQRRQAEAELELFGITDPLQQLGIRNRAVTGRSPAFDRVLNGLDLSTAEGREQARQNAQILFDVLRAGGGTLSAADLGGLTGDELLEALLALVRGLNEVDEALGLNTTTATELDRIVVADRTQITSDQASRLLGLASSQLTELRIIREALTASRSPIPLPSSGVFAGGAPAGTTIVINQTVEVGGIANEGGIAGLSIDAIVEAVRRALGTDVIVRRQYAGQGALP